MIYAVCVVVQSGTSGLSRKSTRRFIFPANPARSSIFRSVLRSYTIQPIAISYTAQRKVQASTEYRALDIPLLLSLIVRLTQEKKFPSMCAPPLPASIILPPSHCVLSHNISPWLIPRNNECAPRTPHTCHAYPFCRRPDIRRVTPYLRLRCLVHQ
jgi:hypothetical protein